MAIYRQLSRVRCLEYTVAIRNPTVQRLFWGLLPHGRKCLGNAGASLQFRQTTGVYT
jgi:hypothetical protein